jgi:hypothetical protein
LARARKRFRSRSSFIGMSRAGRRDMFKLMAAALVYPLTTEAQIDTPRRRL